MGVGGHAEHDWNSSVVLVHIPEKTSNLSKSIVIQQNIGRFSNKLPHKTAKNPCRCQCDAYKINISQALEAQRVCVCLEYCSLFMDERLSMMVGRIGGSTLCVCVCVLRTFQGTKKCYSFHFNNCVWPGAYVPLNMWRGQHKRCYLMMCAC